MLAFGKKAKKIFGKKTGKILPICAANLLIFFVVGVWHGAAWKYIIYGLYNGLIIAASNLLKTMGRSLSCEYGKPGLEDISDIQNVYFSQYRLAL